MRSGALSHLRHHFEDALPGEAYRSNLSMAELIAEIQLLLKRQRLIERLFCRYLADLADRVDAGSRVKSFAGYLDVYDAAENLFGLGVRQTRERVRVGRALRDLPHIERAFDRGDLSYSRVREITRVADAESEPAWLELGRDLPIRELERRVSDAIHRTTRRSERESVQRPEPSIEPRRRIANTTQPGTFEPVGPTLPQITPITPHSGPVPYLQSCHTANDLSEVPANTTRRARGAHVEAASDDQRSPVDRDPTRTTSPLGNDATPHTVRVVLDLPSDCWIMVRRAMAAVRRSADRPMSDAEALAVVARRALASEPHEAKQTLPRAPAQQGGETDVVTHTGSRPNGSSVTHTGSRSNGSSVTHTGSRSNGSSATHTGSRSNGSSATHTGSRSDLTHAGRPADNGSVNPIGDLNALSTDSGDALDTPPGEVSEERAEITRNASLLFRLMRTRASWSVDELCDATGFSIQTVSAALLDLRLDRIVRGGPMRYHVF